MSIRNLFIVSIIGLVFLPGCKDPGFNLGFEQADSTLCTAVGWDFSGIALASDQNSIRLDSIHKYSGFFSIRMDEGRASYTIPAVYEGDSIELRGYLKTESIPENCTRGFFLKLEDGEGELHSKMTKDQMIQFDGVWQEYSLKIPLHKYAREIVFGSFIYGQGTIWVDELQLLVDGRPLKRIRSRDLLLYPALSDTSFNESSGISIDKITPLQHDNLALLGKVWGFVKYYHPHVAQGELNMDSELFRILPGVLKASNPGERDIILSDWLKAFGKIPVCKSCKVKIEGDHKLLPDLSWIENAGIGEDLKFQLIYILENRNQGPHYYVSKNPGIGNPVFKHETRYRKMQYPDDGYRLLALFRYWNMIQYFFPYKNLIMEDWNEILPEYISVFLDAKNDLDYRLVVLHLIGRIHDTHANIMGRDSILENYRGEYFAPVQLRFIENRAVVTGYYDEGLGKWTGLKPGDIIVSIDSRKVEEIVQERLEYYPASNHVAKLRDIGRDLLRGHSGTVKLKYSRYGSTGELKISRYLKDHIDRSADFTAYQPEESYRMIGDSVGYIYLGKIRNEMLEDIFNDFAHTRGIIIDIRNYPSEFVVFTLGKYLMPEPVEFVKFSSPDLTYPGLFSWKDPPAVGEYNPDYYKGRVVILVNEISQSQAEYTAMALRLAPSALVVGSTTAGADGNVSSIFLPGNLFTMISGIGIYYPDGTETQRIGILPDIEFNPTIRGIREGRDEILEKAIELIENDDI